MKEIYKQKKKMVEIFGKEVITQLEKINATLQTDELDLNKLFKEVVRLNEFHAEYNSIIYDLFEKYSFDPDKRV